MARWVVIGVVLFVLYKLVANEMRKRAGESTPAKAPPRDGHGSNMVKDPTCGSYVETTSSVSVRDRDTVHHFCSYECRDAFLEKLRGTGREIPQNKKRDDD